MRVHNRLDQRNFFDGDKQTHIFQTMAAFFPNGMIASLTHSTAGHMIQQSCVSCVMQQNTSEFLSSFSEMQPSDHLMLSSVW